MRKTISRKPITISEVAEEFYRSNKAKGLASATCEIYKTYISAFIQWYSGSVKPELISLIKYCTAESEDDIFDLLKR